MDNSSTDPTIITMTPHEEDAWNFLDRQLNGNRATKTRVVYDKPRHPVDRMAAPSGNGVLSAKPTPIA